MLKELTVLVIVLWGSLGMPTPTPSPEQELSRLIKLYCKAEDLLQEYKAMDKKHLSEGERSKMRAEFSQPGCNFTKSAEECQTLLDFQGLFAWLKDIHQQDGLLKPVMGTFNFLIDLQGDYVNRTCSPSDKMPEFNCPKYSEEDQRLSRENMFHYVFELFEKLTREFLSLKLKQGSPSEVCKAAGF